MPAPIGDLAQISGPAQQEKARVQIGAAPKVDPDAAGQTLGRETVRLIDVNSGVSWDNGDDKAEVRDIRRLLIDGATLVTSQSIDPSQRAYQITDQGGRVFGESDSLGLLADSVLSRGSRTSMMARLGAGLTPYGDPIGPTYGLWNLRQTSLRFRKLLLGDSVQHVAAFIGDSYTQYAPRYLQALASTWQSQYGDAGVGYISFGWSAGNSGTWAIGGTQPTIIDGNVRTDLCAVGVNGTWTCSYNVAANNTPSLSRITSSTPGDYVRWSFPAGHSATTLYYYGTGDGVVQVSWDDGATWSGNISLSAIGAGNVGLIGTPAGSGNAWIKVISGTVSLAGADMQSTANGVRVHKLGGSGSNSGQWAAVTQATWAAQLLALNPQLVVILHGTNDQGSAYLPTTAAGYISTVVSNVRSVLPYSDIWIVSPAENARTTNVYPMTAYAQAQREFAVANRCAYLDFQYLFGPPDNNAAYYADTNAAWPLLASDKIHPDPPWGGRLMTDGFIQCAEAAMAI